MSRQLRVAVGLFSLLLFVAMPAQALGPVDGEVSAVWWNNEYAVDEGGLGASEDAAAPGFLAELWLFNRYGLRAGVYSSDLDDVGLDSSDYMSVDLLWRAFSPTENSFFALGAGWTEMDLSTIGLDGDTSGARLTAEGRVGIIALLYLYGQGAYMPALDDAPATDPALGRFEDVESTELELGVSWKILPVLSLRAGYRKQEVEFLRTGFIPLAGSPPEVSGQVESDGFLAGLTARF
jgi:hypothetical protein